MKAGGKTHGRACLELGVLLHVALVMDLNAHWHEALAATGAATAQDVATVFGLHTGAETKLAFPGTLGWLVGPLGHNRVGSKSSFTFRSEPGGSRKQPSPSNRGRETTQSQAFVK